MTGIEQKSRERQGMDQQQQIAELEQKVKKFAKTMANRCDVSRYQELLFGLLAMRCASESIYGEHGLAVAEEVRWGCLKRKKDSLSFDDVVANSLEAFEKSDEQLKGLFPSTGKIIVPGIVKPVFELIDSLPLSSFKSIDLIGRIYEYLNTGTGGRKSGIFFTPDCVAQLLAEMLQTYGGIIYDPCYGTGTMFVHAINFIRKNRKCAKGVYFCGQESNSVLNRLCCLNLALRGFDNSRIRWNTGGSLLNDAFPELKAHYILTNPPFNQKDWDGEKLKDDPRWQFGNPPKGNANFAWLQHVLSHLSPESRAGILLSNGSLSSSNSAESRIRQKITEAGVVECVIGLPGKLFLNTSIPVCMWVLSS